MNASGSIKQMIRKTPQKMSKASTSPHDDVRYHRMTAQNDGFVDMQVIFQPLGLLQISCMNVKMLISFSLKDQHLQKYHGKLFFWHFCYSLVAHYSSLLDPCLCLGTLIQRFNFLVGVERIVYLTHFKYLND